MDPNKSLDEIVSLIATLLHDVQTSHGAVFNSRSLKLTLNKVRNRIRCEGISFLTKTLPRYGKALDKALSGGSPFNAAALGLKPIRAGSNLPMLFGELMSRVLSHDGTELHDSCKYSVRSLRLITYCFYKYALPYEDKDCEKVISSFRKTEDDLTTTTLALRKLRASVDAWTPVEIQRNIVPVHGRLIVFSQTGRHGRRNYTNFGNRRLQRRRSKRKVRYSYPWWCHWSPNTPELSMGTTRRPTFMRVRIGGRLFCSKDRTLRSNRYKSTKFVACRTNWHNTDSRLDTIRTARGLLTQLFADFDPKDVYPKHGPGAVATKQELWDKFLWKNISANITAYYPLDQYFMASTGHVCDAYKEYKFLKEESLSAKVLLVPKDSRGPRLISSEPVDNQWIQQGLGRAIVTHVEDHYLTKHSVFFTNQRTNQLGALLGSSTGKYATLDLKEASDRVSVELVRLLFPARIVEALEACRSLSTVLPDGTELKLLKFAPMGSSLCFPIMALTIWAILAAAAPDADTRERIAVYGDDVIVTTAFAANAIEQLESYGLKINRDKSCTSGSFRESCGCDAYKGIEVTPVRFKTVWSSAPRPDVYTAWIEYANALYDRRCFATYDLIVARLHQIYGDIPDEETYNKDVPSLRVVADNKKPKVWRVNHDEQRLEWRVRYVRTPPTFKVINGWSMLLRYFSEAPFQTEESLGGTWTKPAYAGTEIQQLIDRNVGIRPFSVRLYTRRRESMLSWRWR